jgi:hypothetical protein
VQNPGFDSPTPRERDRDRDRARQRDRERKEGREEGRTPIIFQIFLWFCLYLFCMRVFSMIVESVDSCLLPASECSQQHYLVKHRFWPFTFFSLPEISFSI